MDKSIVLIRHSATDWNKEGRLQGQTDISLAEGASEHLKQLNVPSCLDKYQILCSPLKRCIQTAQALFPCRDIIISPLLIERNYGNLEGVHLSDEAQLLAGRFKPHALRTWDWAPLNGESNKQVLKRVLNFFSTTNIDTIGITHTGPIQCAIAYATRSVSFPAIEHEAIYAFRINENEALTYLGCDTLR